MTRPYIAFILSLVISDAFASFLLGFQLLFGSYLPVVHNVSIDVCFLLAAEALKLAGIIITVFHLLIMVSIHLAGVVNPVKFKEYLTLRACRILVLLLWAIPLVGIKVTFMAIPGQGFQRDNTTGEHCTKFHFLSAMPFRAAYSTFIIVPTAAIIFLYLFFHSMLWRRRDVTKSSISRQNIRAARVTFLIILTCTCGWLPAVVNHLVVCNVGCLYKYEEFSREYLFIMHAVGYLLVILKSFSNPLIFAFRQANIQHALIRLHVFVCCCCRLKYAEKALLDRKVSRYSVTRTSTNRARSDSTRIVDRNSVKRVSRIVNNHNKRASVMQNNHDHIRRESKASNVDIDTTLPNNDVSEKST